MQNPLIENLPILPKVPTTILVLYDDQEHPCSVRGYSLNDETKSDEEQTRLLMSWHAVLGQIGSSEAGAGQW
jgi:hypothetical protein